MITQLEAADKLRKAVLDLDLGLTQLIGTTEYPDELTDLHVNMRDAALTYDDAKNRDHVN